ncbi:MAG: hypothetical protein KDD89_00780 [Anaerolineales bacterium]|nr:hypothetical protein [Anaerolineales bacterium]
MGGETPAWSFVDGSAVLGNGAATASYADLPQFTISTWLDAGENQNVFVSSAGGTWGAAFGYEAEDIDAVDSGLSLLETGLSPVTSAGSHHYAIQADGDSMKLYRDGTEVDTTTQYAANVLSAVNFSGGGSVDTMSIYSGVTDPAALYAAGPVSCLDLLDPTSVTIGRQLINLPSGKLAAVDYQLSAGELFVGSILLVITFILLWPQLTALANFNSKR